MKAWLAAEAWLPEGWRRNVRIEVDGAGVIARVVPDSDARDAERIDAPVLPGLCDLHCHAFQRAFSGLAEGSQHNATTDTFWTWRELMYRYVQRLTPEGIEAVATALYIELLKGGYTSVCEFHYVHHDGEGKPYVDPAETSERIVRAADSAGIGLTLLPVLYMTSTFGVAATPRQQPFLSTPDAILRMVQDLRARHPELMVGVAPHSLRAVPADALAALLDGFASLGGGPIHLHAAEQEREVVESVAWSGARPVEWLLAHAGVDERWCLVHATHMTRGECAALARTGAVAGLCPSTEGNLGDGFFLLPEFLAAGGTFGIGSDSNVTTRAAEELRLLEYSQRLLHRRRIVASDNQGSAGAALYAIALRGGARAAGRPIGGIAPGMCADLVTLDRAHSSLLGHESASLLDAYVFAGHGNPVRDVMTAGRWVVTDRHHAAEHSARARFQDVVRKLA